MEQSESSRASSSSSSAAAEVESAESPHKRARTTAPLPYRELKPFDELTRQGQIYRLGRVFDYASEWGVSREQQAVDVKLLCEC